jgi:DNA-binding Lrp family transcriptional regulator
MTNVQIQIDEIDIKILRELVKDARAKLKDIAKTCGLSSAAVFNRIKRLKAEGVITGALIFKNMSQIGYIYPASIGINLKPEQEPIFRKLLTEQTNLVLLNPSAGSSGFAIFLVAKSLKDIEDLKQLIIKLTGNNRITVSLWSTPHFILENLDLKPTKS